MDLDVARAQRLAELEELFRAVNRAHLRRTPAATSVGCERRLEFALGRFREGRHAFDYLTSRYPEDLAGAPPLLDIGCGNGGMLLPFAAAGWPCAGVELTPHPELTTVAAGLPVRQVTAAGERLPFRAESFSLVLLAETLEHVERPAQLGREAMRVLAPGGLVYLTTPPRLRYLARRDPHYGVPGLALLPDWLQRRVFERWIAPGAPYGVVHLFWSVAGVLRQFPGLELVEITSKNWSGPLRRLDWDWIVGRKPRPRPAA